MAQITRSRLRELVKLIISPSGIYPDQDAWRVVETTKKINVGATAWHDRRPGCILQQAHDGDYEMAPAMDLDHIILTELWPDDPWSMALPERPDIEVIDE